MAKNNWRIVTVGFALFAIIILALVINPFVDHLIYPVRYHQQILTHADQTGLDPFLVMAIIRVETKFKANEESNRGAQGLMQLMPETVKFAIQKGGFTLNSKEHIWDPRVNIQIGTWYLSFLMKEFNGNVTAVIASYNAGPGNVRRWLKGKKWDGTWEHVEKIPFRETRNYVKKVHYFYDRYKDKYSK